MDEKASRNPSKGPARHPKRPERKSLPTLPSQKTSSASAGNGHKTHSSKTKKEENTTNTTNEKTSSDSLKDRTTVYNAIETESSDRDAEPSETQFSIDDNSIVEEQSFPTAAIENECNFP